jgi:hypothetical protein
VYALDPQHVVEPYGQHTETRVAIEDNVLDATTTTVELLSKQREGSLYFGASASPRNRSVSFPSHSAVCWIIIATFRDLMGLQPRNGPRKCDNRKCCQNIRRGSSFYCGFPARGNIMPLSSRFLSCYTTHHEGGKGGAHSRQQKSGVETEGGVPLFWSVYVSSAS